MRIFLVVLLLSPFARAESFQSWAARGARAEREKNIPLALQAYSNALSSWKSSDGRAARAKILCARGALRDRSGNEAGALEDYGACLAIDKKNAKVFDRRGQLRLKTGAVSAAIDDFYKATAIDIKFAQAYAHRAQAYALQGDHPFAREDYRHACRLGFKAACPAADAAEPPRPPAAAVHSEPLERPRVARAPGRSETPPPRFVDCLDFLQACIDRGEAYGTCVGKAPICEKKSLKGCCPGACVGAYRKVLNDGASEAQAYRAVFIPRASCALIDKK